MRYPLGVCEGTGLVGDIASQRWYGRMPRWTETVENDVPVGFTPARMVRMRLA